MRMSFNSHSLLQKYGTSDTHTLNEKHQEGQKLPMEYQNSFLHTELILNVSCVLALITVTFS